MNFEIKNWKESIRYCVRAMSYRFKLSDVKMKVTHIIILVMSTASTAMTLVTAAFVSNAALVITGEHDRLSMVLTLFLIQALYGFAADMLSAYKQRLEISDIMIADTKVKGDLHEKICKVPYKCFDNDNDFKTIFNAASGAENYLRRALMIINLPFSVISMLISVLILTYHNPVAMVISVVSCVPDYFITKRQGQWSFYDKIINTEEYELQDIYANIAVRRESIREVHFYNIGDYIRNTWENWVMRLNRRVMKAMTKFMLANIGVGILKNLSLAVILIIAAWSFIDNPIVGIGVFYLIYNSSQNLQGQVRSVISMIADIRNDSMKYKAFFTIMDWEEEAVTIDASAFDNVEIVFDDVSFAYTNCDNDVINNISITIKQGEKIAIIGENGSGKTTFISMLCGLYQPTRGDIYINGDKLSDVLSETRKSISMIPQEFGKYNLTIRENIICGDIDRDVSDDEIAAICKLTGLDKVVASKSAGLDTMIGSFSEKQENLSGGEWQRLALTRALIKRGARLLILDEPTASLDPMAESELYEQFQAISGERTTLLISHRLGASALVDRILVFKGGRIVEDGSHDDLVALDGEYAAMYHAQAQWYVG